MEKPQFLKEYKLLKYLQLKYSVLPVAIMVIFFYYFIDVRAENLVLLIPEHIRSIFKVITFLGDSSWIIISTLLIIITLTVYKIRKKEAITSHNIYKLLSPSIFILSSVILSGILVQILKCIIGRARPVLFSEHGAAYFHHFNFFEASFSSMPSGHSTTIGSLFACLMLIFPKHRYLWLILAIFIASTRVIVLKHYPSDVIFGLALGMYTSIYLFKKFWDKV
ncbi:phosphatase PAP2 family protein [Allofrancisella frigidaquae]|uniref:undecaprenyl-diphosphate phosphatase n=1 Tax=Allofrancisella frigidaquae TaxID=1085644 RepID=A0A6M3HUA5_9GAMM|nr:phosphatase PAP2 family protein [Allofrancisella frigidaquae]QIV94808.1 phosphatase PAP2 family protein [Allofrancisella frigidaquae]